ncbi:MAG TPA: VIT family protein [Cellvibrionaceae bacterium]
MAYIHTETHRGGRAGWLRAAVLGANDGIISLACLIIGMAAGHASTSSIVLAALAGVFAGALSMAAGEYVSVQSQADLEEADIRKETKELADEPARELLELKGIYRARGLSSELAMEVAKALTAHNALEAHLRDELGIVQQTRAAPILASLASALSFVLGAALPCISLLFTANYLLPVAAGISLVCLFILGGWGAHMGGAPIIPAANRVLILGAIAMVITAGAGFLLGNFI